MLSTEFVVTGPSIAPNQMVCEEDGQLAAEALAAMIDHGRPMTVKQLARTKGWEASLAARVVSYLSVLEMLELVVGESSHAGFRPAADLLADLAA
jgi:hypothetical protein